MRRIKICLAALAAAGSAGAVAAAPASAAFTCDASALRGSVLGQAPIEPVTANRGQEACAPAQGGGASVLPAPLATSAIFAETGLTGPSDTPAAQTATASGGVADLRIGPPTNLGLVLPVDQALAALPPVTVPGVGTLDLRQAVLAALQPSPELLRIQAAVAYAKATCESGQMQLTGSSQIAGIKLLGLDLPTDQAVTQVVQAVGGGSIDPSQLDIAQLLPPGVTLTPLIETLVRPVLNALPPIQIPPALAEVRITPNQQIREGNKLTQRALQVYVAIASQPVLDLTIGEASVGASDIDCATAPPATVNEAALQCTNRRLVLIDVLPAGRRVRLYGAADRRYVGKTVSIFFHHTGRRVARARVREDGTFRTTARMPSRRIRDTNRARYQARIGRQRSLRLKLARRMRVRQLEVEDGKVQIRGRISRPLAKPIRSIEVRQRESCKKWKVVKRIKPNRRGFFNTTVDAPEENLAGTYRFATKVRHNTGNPKTFPTFTLPQYVD